MCRVLNLYHIRIEVSCHTEFWVTSGLSPKSSMSRLSFPDAIAHWLPGRTRRGAELSLAARFNWKKCSQRHLMPLGPNYVFIYVALPAAEPAGETQGHGKNTKLRVRTLEGMAHYCLWLLLHSLGKPLSLQCLALTWASPCYCSQVSPLEQCCWGNRPKEVMSGTMSSSEMAPPSSPLWGLSCVSTMSSHFWDQPYTWITVALSSASVTDGLVIFWLCVWSTADAL